MESDGGDDQYLNLNQCSLTHTMMVQNLRIIVQNPHVQNGVNAQTHSHPCGYGSVCLSFIPYTRLFLCHLFSRAKGNLLVYLMESPSLSKKANFWLNNKELHDNCVITVGTVFGTISPLHVTTYLRVDIPLIEKQQPAIILHSPSRYLKVLPLENLQDKSSQVFVLTSATLPCGAYSCEKTECSDSCCDRLGLNELNTPLGMCSCYTKHSCVPTILPSSILLLRQLVEGGP
mmetsp:Transcript_27482/g.39817  ORF Transcript_27482/g.39817 Transcript_27482/m.39817 type:complete len:231 (-) Transcript_27482:1099-1791(-)